LEVPRGKSSSLYSGSSRLKYSPDIDYSDKVVDGFCNHQAYQGLYIIWCHGLLSFPSFQFYYPLPPYHCTLEGSVSVFLLKALLTVPSYINREYKNSNLLCLLPTSISPRSRNLTLAAM
jgi:hypothetical protein